MMLAIVPPLPCPPITTRRRSNLTCFASVLMAFRMTFASSPIHFLSSAEAIAKRTVFWFWHSAFQFCSIFLRSNSPAGSSQTKIAGGCFGESASSVADGLMRKKSCQEPNWGIRQKTLAKNDPSYQIGS